MKKLTTALFIISLSLTPLMHADNELPAQQPKPSLAKRVGLVALHSTEIIGGLAALCSSALCGALLHGICTKPDNYNNTKMSAKDNRNHRIKAGVLTTTDGLLLTAIGITSIKHGIEGLIQDFSLLKKSNKASI